MGGTKRARKTGTREWSARSVNCCTGCSNGCLYCYAADTAARFGRRRREDWRREEPRAADVAAGRASGRVMFPTSHDITLGNYEACAATLRALVAAGNDVLLVSKAHPWILVDLALALDCKLGYWPWPGPRPELRVTLATLDEDLAAWWEPGAPRPRTRLKALEVARLFGWPTSVSAEPLLDPPGAVDLAAAVDGLLDADELGRGGELWVGKCNRLRRRMRWALDGRAGVEAVEVERRVAWLEAHQTDAWVRRVYEQLTSRDWRCRLRWKDSYRSVLGRCGLLGVDG